jgi:hypothetical protein
MTDKAEKIIKTDTEWQQQLTPEQYAVTRKKATERPFTGEYVHNKADETYCCAGPDIIYLGIGRGRNRHNHGHICKNRRAGQRPEHHGRDGHGADGRMLVSAGIVPADHSDDRQNSTNHMGHAGHA